MLFVIDGRPQFIWTDNEAVFVSRWFQLGLWLWGSAISKVSWDTPGRMDELNGSLER